METHKVLPPRSLIMNVRFWCESICVYRIRMLDLETLCVPQYLALRLPWLTHSLCYPQRGVTICWSCEVQWAGQTPDVTAGVATLSARRRVSLSLRSTQPQSVHFKSFALTSVYVCWNVAFLSWTLACRRWRLGLSACCCTGCVFCDPDWSLSSQKSNSTIWVPFRRSKTPTALLL